MPRPCPRCAVPIPDDAVLCPGCGDDSTRVAGLAAPRADTLTAGGAGGLPPTRVAGGIDPTRAAGGLDPTRVAGGLDPTRVADGAGPPATPRSRAAETAESVGLPPRYRVVRFLGRGGMGRVYHCRDEKLDVDVAIKVLPPEVSEDAGAVAQIEKEARASAKFRSVPGILSLFGFEEHAGTHFLVMELARGGALSDLLKKEGRLSESECRRMGAETAEALAYAHRERYLHRDIKPANILLTEDGRVKVADFGIARVLSDTASKVSQVTVSGTPVYMAPEIMFQGTVDARADLYSLGCMLFELSTGERPFAGSMVEIAMMKTSATARPPFPRAVVPDLSEDFSAVVQRLLEPDPQNRFPDAASCAAALRQGATTAPSVPPEETVVAIRPGAGGAPTVRAAPPHGAAPAAAPPPRPSGRRALVAAAVLLVVGAGVTLALTSGKSGTPPDPPKEDGAAEVKPDKAITDEAARRAQEEVKAQREKEEQETAEREEAVKKEEAAKTECANTLKAVGELEEKLKEVRTGRQVVRSEKEIQARRKADDGRRLLDSRDYPGAGKALGEAKDLLYEVVLAETDKVGEENAGKDKYAAFDARKGAQEARNRLQGARTAFESLVQGMREGMEKDRSLVDSLHGLPRVEALERIGVATLKVEAAEKLASRCAEASEPAFLSSLQEIRARGDSLVKEGRFEEARRAFLDEANTCLRQLCRFRVDSLAAACTAASLPLPSTPGMDKVEFILASPPTPSTDLAELDREEPGLSAEFQKAWDSGGQKWMAAERSLRCAECGATGQCKACTGKGTTESLDKACNGTGSMLVACGVCKGPRVLECPSCHGTKTSSSKCTACGGGVRPPKCDTCNGARRVTCPKCEGKAWHECNNPKHRSLGRRCSCKGDNRVDCGKCDGKKTIPCPGCDGAGTMKCPRCDGLGNAKEACTNCRGEGTVACSACAEGKSRVPCSAPGCVGGKVAVPCSACNGTKSCSACKGEGRIPK